MYDKRALLFETSVVCFGLSHCVHVLIVSFRIRKSEVWNGSGIHKRSHPTTLLKTEASEGMSSDLLRLCQVDIMPKMKLLVFVSAVILTEVSLCFANTANEGRSEMCTIEIHS